MKKHVAGFITFLFLSSPMLGANSLTVWQENCISVYAEDLDDQVFKYLESIDDLRLVIYAQGELRDQQVEKIAKLNKLKFLKVTLERENQLDLLKNLTGLEGLSLRHSRSINFKFFLDHMPNLVFLDLGGVGVEIGESITKDKLINLRNLTHLRYVEFYRNNSDTTPQDLQELSALTGQDIENVLASDFGTNFKKRAEVEK